MKRKLTTMDNISQKGIDVFGDVYNFTLDKAEAQAWIIRSKNLHEEELPEDLRAIGRAGAGTNNIPLNKCADKGIVVFNAPGANSNAVSELVIAMLLLASRDVIGGINWVRANTDDREIAETAEKKKKEFVGCELRGKTLGIIGVGAIGHLVANSAIGIGMEVVAYDPKIRTEYALRLTRKVKLVNSLEEVLKKADYLTLHIPLIDATKGLISEEKISLMKDGAILMNFARDQICDEKAVKKALEKGKLARYVVDFPNEENVRFPNTIVSPHLGGSTFEAEDNCAIDAAKSVKYYLETGNIVNSVNYPDISLGAMESKTRVVVLHRNLPNAITKISGMLGDAGYNIIKMASDSKGEYAAAIIDVNSTLDRAFIMKLEDHPNILRVRVIYKENEYEN